MKACKTDISYTEEYGPMRLVKRRDSEGKGRHALVKGLKSCRASCGFAVKTGATPSIPFAFIEKAYDMIGQKLDRPSFLRVLRQSNNDQDIRINKEGQLEMPLNDKSFAIDVLNKDGVLVRLFLMSSERDRVGLVVETLPSSLIGGNDGITYDEDVQQKMRVCSVGIKESWRGLYQPYRASGVKVATSSLEKPKP